MPKNNKIPQISSNNKIPQASLISIQMHKDYNQWNKIKKKLSSYGKRKVKVGSIYWARIGLNVGNEINGKGADSSRPVLVISVFKNLSFWGIPLSSKNKPSYLEFLDSNGVKQHACVEQMRCFDSTRIKRRKIATVDEKNLDLIREKIKEIIEPR